MSSKTLDSLPSVSENNHVHKLIQYLKRWILLDHSITSLTNYSRGGTVNLSVCKYSLVILK